MRPIPLAHALFAMALLAFATGAKAQTFTVTAGEHGAFTRLVVRAEPGVTWVLDGAGQQRALIFEAPGAGFDLSSLFDRIPRTRLSSARTIDQRLELTLGCDCDIRAWEERPGLIVLDISEPTTAPVGLSPVETGVDALAAARAAGASVARDRPIDTASPATAPPLSLSAEERNSLTNDLGVSVAQALGQGILDPAVDHATPPVGLLPGSDPPQMPANMQVVSVLDRPAPGAQQVASPAAECQGAEVLDALLSRESVGFPEAYGTASQQLYGEFDQPVASAQHALIMLYLASGFGAEARSLIDNAVQPLPGREFALGLADVLEGRVSNSRMRLARGIGCGGVTALAATLAGAVADRVAEHASQIALTFTQVPETLRALIGLDVVRALAAARSIDAARIVADSLHGSPWTVPQDAALAEALLARSRGHVPEAAARLAMLPATNPEAVQERLNLALDSGADLPSAVLEDAETLAATSRNDEAGPALMATIIRLRAGDSNPASAFVVLDRLETWMPSTGENTRLLMELRDETWAAVAQSETDLSLIETVLAREDWRSPDLGLPTRQALAERLIDLGFPRPASDLLGNGDDPTTRLLRARIELARNAPMIALELARDLEGQDAVELRASALSQSGDHAAAAEELAQLGAIGDAIRAAILAGNWRLVETLRTSALAEAPPSELDDLLGRAPGHAEVLRLVEPQDGSSETVTTTEPVAPLQTQEPEAEPEPPSTGEGAAPEAPVPPPTADGTFAPTDAQPVVPQTDVAPVAAIDVAEAFDRMGMIRRSSTLMAESERLRLAVGALVERETN